MNSERDAWLERSRTRTRNALLERSAPGDRLALIRTLAWLNGGRVDLNAEQMNLTPSELGMLSRFGLSSARDGSVVRTEEDESQNLPEEFGAALTLDPDHRTLSV